MEPDNTKPVPAGDGIAVSAGNWSFDGAVPEVFDRHVSKSIPGYAAGHRLVMELARPILAEGGLCYELGCSTGTLTALLAACADPLKTKIIGLDQIDSMLGLAISGCAEYPHVRFERANVVDYAYSTARLIVSYYTLQFIPIPQRIALVDRIFSSLEPGGAFLLFEKTHYDDPVKDQALTQAYHAFKQSQGFSRAFETFL